MDLYKETVEEIRRLIESNRGIFYDNKGNFNLSSSELNDIAYVYENYQGEMCKIFLEDKKKRNRGKANVYDKMIEIIEILEKNSYISNRRSIGRYIIKNLDIIIKNKI